MRKRLTDFDLSLLQKDPREALAKSKGMLTEAPPMRRPDSRPGRLRPLTVGLACAGLAACLVFVTAQRPDAILARLGYQSVSSLPEPEASLGADEQALYWTYALYDFGKLKAAYGIEGYFAVDESYARGRLEVLLPHVSALALGEISGYAPVAFRTLPMGVNP